MGARWGAIGRGASGFLSPAAASVWAPAPPEPGLCWCYTDATRRNAFWYTLPVGPSGGSRPTAERRVPYARDEQRRFPFGKSETHVSVFRCRFNDHDRVAAPGALFEPPMRRRNLENHESRAWTKMAEIWKSLAKKLGGRGRRPP